MIQIESGNGTTTTKFLATRRQNGNKGRDLKEMAMTTINLSEHHAAALAARASIEGLTLEAWLEKMAEEEIRSHPQDNPEEWARRLDAFMDSQDAATPVLSLEAMTRENIYP